MAPQRHWQQHDRLRRRLPGFAVGTLLLTGACTVGPDYRAPSPAGLALPGQFQTHAGTAADTADLVQWWTGFGDPLLSRLIDTALHANNDLAAAGSRLRAARAAVRVADSARLPMIGASSALDQPLSRATGPGNGRSVQLGIDAAWEADLFGGTRRSVEAARATAQAFEADLHAVHLTIAAEVALSYIDARTAQARLAIATDNLAYQDESVEIAGWRVEAGLVSAPDLEQSRVLRAQTAALLQNRPDLIAAERSLAAETARIGVATAQLYPALRLSGLVSTTATSLGGIGTSVLGGLTSAVTAPIFQGGRIRAQIEGQTATADAALADYRQTVLIALEERSRNARRFAGARLGHGQSRADQ